MYSVGFYSIYFAVESGSQQILDRAEKALDISVISPIIAAATKLGYFSRGFFIIGLPGETLVTINQTLKIALQMKLEGALFFIFTPLPGSELFDQWIQDKDLNSIHWDFDYFSNPQDLHQFNNLSPTQLKKLQRYLYMRFYILRPWKLIKYLLNFHLAQFPIIIDKIKYLINK